MIKYMSTRGSSNIKSGAQAVIAGMAEDRGLYVPDKIPALPFKPGDMTGKTYKEIAAAVIGAFFFFFTNEEIKYCIDGAYTDKFEAEDVVPVVTAGDASFLELYHGRTAAFKDMALSILPYLLTTALKKENEDKKICILTATSGDTGKAALEGFADVPGTEIIVFFPNKGVSAVQERQMVSQKGKNVHVFAVNGNFDDTQTGVKNIFEDDAIAAELADKGVKLSSANSINIGRLVPQVAYYVYGYIKLIEQGVISDGDQVNVVVPTGNFGNILAAYYSKLMGIPVRTFICASNKNKVLTDFISTGTYDKNREFYMTNSPSMDILISSNLERLLYHLAGGNADEVRALMNGLESEGKYTVSEKIREGLGSFYGGFADVSETNATIGKMYEENGYLMDTHTAVAYKVYEDYRQKTGDETPTLIASTASAYKFAGSVTSSLGMEKCESEFDAVSALEEKTGVRVPACLKDLENAPVRHGDVIDIADMPDSVRKSLSVQK